MSKLSAARAGVPRSKAEDPVPFNSGTRQLAFASRAAVLTPVCKVFLEHGAAAAARFVGSTAKLAALWPDMKRRIEYWERSAKRAVTPDLGLPPMAPPEPKVKDNGYIPHQGEREMARRRRQMRISEFAPTLEEAA